MAITKDDISRDDLVYSMLRQVIIRADFTSMLDTDKIVLLLNEQKWFEGAFNNYSRLQYIDNGRQRGKEDVTERPRKYVRRFDDCNIQPERRVVLDITDESLCLDIQCDEHYTVINEYLSLFVQTLGLIISNDNYVKLRRLAIRKIDGERFPNGNEAEKVFEYFDQRITDLDDDAFWQRTYTDNFIYGKRNVKVNYTRNVKISSREEDRFIFTIDIDTYIDSEMIMNARPSKDELLDIYFDRLNESTFELFKRGVTLEFLTSILRKHE
jgi:uncharacterized protein (TIGR04255 family)